MESFVPDFPTYEGLGNVKELNNMVFELMDKQ